MPTYDMSCPTCETTIERRCLISERETQACEDCGATLTPLFSPNFNVFIPRAFGYSFSDLFGTSSEKEYLKENPGLEKVNPTTFKSQREIRAERKAEADRTVADIERAIKANKTLRTDGRKSKKSGD